MTPAEVRAKIMINRPIWSNLIYQHAHERGEIDLDKLPRRC
jgi:hypothetical protein